MFTQKDIDRFWSKVEKSDRPDGCWEWTRSTIRFGYGQFEVAGKYFAAHRFSWTLVNGPITDGLFVCHKCDNPRCVRPKHLFLGTHTDNMRDASVKGRLKYPQDGGHLFSSGNSFGKEHRFVSKLTPDDVQRMRDLRAQGMTFRRIAKELGVTDSCVVRIINGRRWKDAG